MTKHRVRILTGDNIPERFEGVLDANASQGWRFLSMLPSSADALCWVEQREDPPIQMPDFRTPDGRLFSEGKTK